MSDLIFKIEKRANDKYDLIYEGGSSSFTYKDLSPIAVELIAQIIAREISQFYLDSRGVQ